MTKQEFLPCAMGGTLTTGGERFCDFMIELDRGLAGSLVKPSQCAACPIPADKEKIRVAAEALKAVEESSLCVKIGRAHV